MHGSHHTTAVRHADGSSYNGHGDLEEGEYDLEGDVEYGDISEGDIDLSLGDVTAIQEGAPFANVVARKRIGKRKASSNPGRSAAIASSIGMASSMGKLIDTVGIPAIIPKNAVVKQEATSTRLPGALVAANIRRMLTLSCYQSLMKTVRPAGTETSVDVVLDKSLFDQAGGTVQMFYVPMIFVTISASVLNAVSGGLYTFQFIEGVGESGPTIDQSIWKFERADATKPMNLIIIPYTRVKDVIKPINGIISNDQYLASDNQIVLRITGLSEGEQIQITVPGLDSLDLKSFQQAYSIKG